MPLATPEELIKYPPPPLPRWIVKRDLLPDADSQIHIRKPETKSGKPGEIYWSSSAGPQTWGLVSPFDETTVGGARGGGKLSPLESTVCTPKGFVRMGDIEVGDSVTDPTTGGSSKVIAIHPHPRMPIWKFTFDDGASLEVGADHLWAYRLSNHLRPGSKRSSEREYAKSNLNSAPACSRWDRNRIGTTDEVRGLFESGCKIRIPLTEPVIFTNRSNSKASHVAAYMIGLFLGDGYLRKPGITSNDPEIIEYLQSFGFSKEPKEGTTAFTLRARGHVRVILKRYFQNHGMTTLHSWDKFIPPQYKCGPLSERLDVLRGLLDTDGTVDERGRVYYCSTSKQLAEDVQFIVRSIGGKAKIRIAQKYFRSNGEKKAGRIAYIVRIWHPKTSALFTLPRKIKRCTDRWNGGLEISRQLVSVEYVGEKEARCITVSSPYGLYVADDFVVTHNSALLIAWFAMGDPTLPKEDPAHHSYLLEPSYRGLVLRKEYQSLAEFIDESSDFFGPLGGKASGDPVVFTFKSGAKIYTNHLGDKNAFEKQRGAGFTRIGIEELTQIEEERWYLKLLGSLRAKKQIRRHNFRDYPALRSQIMSTTNPDGPGSAWVKRRFVKVLDPKGREIPWNTPMRDPISGLYRIFVPMKITDNPYLRENAQYRGMLMSQDESTRKMWLDGLWTSASVYFTEWRPNGPVTLEEREKYPWARHIVEPVELQPWWYRFSGGDWGYSHPTVFHKCCRNERDGRIHVYDELSLRNCGSFEVGVRLAQWWLPELENLPDKTITVAFSPDAFSKTDATRTKAEQVADGIRSVLGPYGSFLMKYSDEERMAMGNDPDLAKRMFSQRRAESQNGNMCIVLKPASTDTVARWSYMRELLRFRPVVKETQDELKKRLSEVYSRAGVEAYERELSKTKKPDDGALPRLQIWKGRCPGLVRCMEEANRDEKNPEKVAKWDADSSGNGGDDPLDSIGMALHHFKEVETTMPRVYFVSQQMENIQTQYEQNYGDKLVDPNRLIMVHKTQEAIYNKAHPSQQGSISFSRNSVNRHRQPHGQRMR